jgi:PST family polysaccharide transporter
MFKELSIIRVCGNLAEFTLKVGSAAAGFGVWCFLIGRIARFAVVGIGVQIVHPWRPRLIFRYRQTIAWVRYGLKQSASQLVYQFYSNADYQMVGYFFGAELLGLYGAAYELVIKPCQQIGESVQGVAFPTYARLKSRSNELVEQYLSFTRLTMIAMLALLAAVAAAPAEMLTIFFGEKFAPAATAAQAFCVLGLLRAMSVPIQPLLDGVGRPGLNLTYNVIAGVTLPSLFALSATLFGDEASYMAVVWAWVVGEPIGFAILQYMARRSIDLSFARYARRIGPILTIAAAAAAMGAAAHWTTAGLSLGSRLTFVLISVVTVFLFLLVYWQGITPRFLKNALSAKPASPAPANPTNEEM